MALYSRLLVPLDGSELAERALPHATTLARQFGSTLHILRVVPPLPALAHGHILVDVEQALAAEAQSYLESVQARLSAEGCPAEIAYRIGSPADEIIAYAAENDIRLIVMHTHGRSGISRWVYGSVAHRILQGAECPVLLVRTPLGEAAA
jgi:nucleotide-binding universal stress UspA family protein